ncbi:MAG: hypothetical protein M3P48_04440 [Actinomycetota bacterium]|nr:hypothetical protein [Actinomycetota bacterium]
MLVMSTLPESPTGRRRRLAATRATLVVLLAAAVASVAWRLATNRFPAYDEGARVTARVGIGEEAHINLFAIPKRAVTLVAAEPVVSGEGSRVVRVQLSTTGPDGVVGADVGDLDASSCLNRRRAAGASVVPRRDHIVVSLVATKPGRVRIDGVRVRYRLAGPLTRTEHSGFPAVLKVRAR